MCLSSHSEREKTENGKEKGEISRGRERDEEGKMERETTFLPWYFASWVVFFPSRSRLLRLSHLIHYSLPSLFPSLPHPHLHSPCPLFPSFRHFSLSLSLWIPYSSVLHDFHESQHLYLQFALPFTSVRSPSFPYTPTQTLSSEHMLFILNAPKDALFLLGCHSLLLSLFLALSNKVCHVSDERKFSLEPILCPKKCHLLPVIDVFKEEESIGCRQQIPWKDHHRVDHNFYFWFFFFLPLSLYLFL